uniref:Aminotransferase class V domain-containing protein n=1 Tax=Caenorhabditis japonica TaxID=281687 RepID=A0A8R1E1N5_CAEJA
MHEAKQEIRAMTGCGDQDAVIFTGSGSTCAVDLLVHLIALQEGVVVIHSCQEHHSNLLPWRNVAKLCVSIDELESGEIDLAQLRRVLQEVREEHGEDLKVIGTFSACSNLTGIVQNVEEITRVLKSHNALAIWDFASAAPYIPISMNLLDAVFFSGHKFPGGVGAPGVLIVKKSLIQAKKPKRIGGGTVFFVTESDEWYLKEVEHREEGGTADAVGAVRLAMAVKMKRAVGTDTIHSLESSITKLVLQKLKRIENFVLLGPVRRENRLPVFSFLIREPKSGLFYHHNYISVLLNDLFGIQTRAGCMCAGPYAQRLLGIDEETATKFALALREDAELDRTHLRRQAEYSQREFLRPGFTRISFPYFFTHQQVDEIVSGLKFVAEHAADFLHLYQVNCETGEWHHQAQRVFHDRRWLGHVQFTSDGLKMKKIDEPMVDILPSYLKLAKKLAQESLESRNLFRIPDGRLAINEEYQELRWFVLPIEIAESTSSGRDIASSNNVVNPKEYAETTSLTATIEETENEQDAPENNVEESCEIACNDVICLLKCDENKNGPPKDDILGDDVAETEDVKLLDDWNKRVIVKPVQLGKEETARLEWNVPPLEMYKKVTDVIHELKMIRNGDKVLVCLSGGKDSLSLLHILRYYQQRCNKARSTSFQLGAITVDPGSAEFNPRPLIDYCRKLNIDYFYEEQDIIGAAKRTPGLRSICAFCSRMKRGRLAAAAQLHGWNVLAMGQHLDDLAESFFIAAFQNGNLSTMKAQYTTKDGTLRVIRPLVLVREKALRNFAEEKKLPIVAENCPACFNQATERHRIKQLLAQQELIFPDLFYSLRSALRPLLLVNSADTSEMRSQAVANIAKSSA